MTITRVFLLLVLACSVLYSQVCPPRTDGDVPGAPYVIDTDEYSFVAAGPDGAVGDVIPVTLSLVSELENRGGLYFQLSLCHDSARLEIVGEPFVSEEFEALLGPFGVQALRIDEGLNATGNHVGHGLVIEADFLPDGYAERFSSSIPLPLMTVFYRVIGPVGGSAVVSFCNGTLSTDRRRCNYNRMHMHNAERVQGWDYVSTGNQDATVTILPGPPTRIELPPQPPRCEVYPSRPTGDEVNFRVYIDSVVAGPGDASVPVDVDVSADVEYSGLELPIDFDERYLRLVRVEQPSWNGVASVNNDDIEPGPSVVEGYVGIFSGLGPSRRRLGSAGEIVTAARLYFDVLDQAAEIQSTTLSVQPVGTATSRYAPWIGVHYLTGIGAETEVRAEIGPIITTRGTVTLKSSRRGTLGDVNLDSRVDISDPIALLGSLFLGGESPKCPGASDFNQDGGIDVSDAVSLLTVLFLSSPPPEVGGAIEVPCS